MYQGELNFSTFDLTVFVLSVFVLTVFVSNVFVLIFFYLLVLPIYLVYFDCFCFYCFVLTIFVFLRFSILSSFFFCFFFNFLDIIYIWTIWFWFYSCQLSVSQWWSYHPEMLAHLKTSQHDKRKFCYACSKQGWGGDNVQNKVFFNDYFSNAFDVHGPGCLLVLVVCFID